MKEPSFFVVGAPKSGTTALCRYLDQHPNIFIPPRKEIYYFDKDLEGKYAKKSQEEYLELFREGKGKICGEGTTSYLRSQVAAGEIYNFNPDAKIIIMLREPVSLLYSFHSQLLWNGSSEEIEDFTEAIVAESDRKQGKRIPKKCKNPEVLFYRDIVCFSEQIERYWQLFSRERVKIILFDDFKKDTDKVYREVLSLIGANPDFSTEFTRINSNKKVKSRFIQNLYKNPPAKLLELGKFLIPLPQAQRRKLLETLKNKLKKSNVKREEREPLSSDFQHKLSQEFYEEIDRLGQLLNRDLSHWKL